MLGGSNGRYDFMSLTKPLNRSSPPHLLQRQGSDPTTARLRASESPTRRRGSSSSTGSASGQGMPEEDGIRLNPSFIRVALSSLLAIDLWLSKRLGVCACEDSSWGSVRPLMKLIEISGHGIPWLAVTAYCLYKSDSAAGQEVMLNLLMGKTLFIVTDADRCAGELRYLCHGSSWSSSDMRRSSHRWSHNHISCCDPFLLSLHQSWQLHSYRSLALIHPLFAVSALHLSDA